ncbi:MAG: hypothetical protein AAGH57_06850 [Pseudomonadota bacterium]
MGPSRAAALVWAALALSGVGLASCKPPPTDAEMARRAPQPEPTYASDPLPSPDTTGAVWAVSGKDTQRLLYGVPGEPALMALACADQSDTPRVQITRMSPADEGAGALLAFVGNGHIGRIEVDAVEVSGQSVWQGEIPASDPALEPLTGPRQFTATIPGAGMVTFNPSPAPMEWLERCRAS